MIAAATLFSDFGFCSLWASDILSNLWSFLFSLDRLLSVGRGFLTLILVGFSASCGTTCWSASSVNCFLDSCELEGVRFLGTFSGSSLKLAARESYTFKIGVIDLLWLFSCSVVSLAGEILLVYLCCDWSGKVVCWPTIMSEGPLSIWCTLSWKHPLPRLSACILRRARF